MNATPEQRAAARDLVLRSRAGDQNATGMIAAIRESAQMGSEKAIAGLNALKTFIMANPAGARRGSIGVEAHRALGALRYVARASKSRMGGEEHDNTNDVLCAILVLLPLIGGLRAQNACSVILANGPFLNKERVAGLASAITSDDHRADFLSCSFGAEPLRKTPYAHAGVTVSKARKIQAVRAPMVPLSFFSERVAWELE